MGTVLSSRQGDIFIELRQFFRIRLTQGFAGGILERR